MKNHRVSPCGSVYIIYSTLSLAEQLLSRYDPVLPYIRARLVAQQMTWSGCFGTLALNDPVDKRQGLGCNHLVRFRDINYFYLVCRQLRQFLPVAGCLQADVIRREIPLDPRSQV